MKRMMPVTELARDERFVASSIEDRLTDPRGRGGDLDDGASTKKRAPAIRQDQAGAPEAARALMHGIFTGEIQALEGAGRTCWDYDVGSGEDEVPFELKLDMARQCWDEARHVEISIRLGEWMGTDIGEFAESTILFEAACNEDPVLRLAGVNRALEGLAIDVFNAMRQFGKIAGDPILEFCEDWMLADEVTHVKMGSDWLRRITEDDPARRERALEFQRVVDKLFSYGGFRGEDDDSPIKLARRFRELAGFDSDEVDEIAELSREAAREQSAATDARRAALRDG